MKCHDCGLAIDVNVDIEDKHVGHGMWSHYERETCVSEMKAELAQWRCGKRRVYWRVDHGSDTSETHRANVRGSWQRAGAKVMRVTVGPRGNVRPWVKK